MHHAHQMIIKGLANATAWETEIFLPKRAASLHDSIFLLKLESNQ